MAAVLSDSLLRAASAINKVAPRHRVRTAGVFGSVARGDDTATSDVDVLALFDDGSTLLDLSEFKRELERELGCDVDLVSTLDHSSPTFKGQLKRDLVIAYEQ